jgi:hypothetical protein
MLPKTVTTSELCKLSGYAKSSITALQQAGVIERVGPDAWSIETLTAIIAHLRERKPVTSNEPEKFERARAQREQMKAEREAGNSIPLSTFKALTDQAAFTSLKWIDAIPARLAGQDLPLRRRTQEVVNWARAGMSADMKALGEGEVD